MIGIGIPVKNTKNGKEGVVVFDPYNNEKGTVSIDYGCGSLVEVALIDDLEQTGEEVLAEIGEGCEGCVFLHQGILCQNRCCRYSRTRFTALSAFRLPEDKPRTPTRKYPECKEEISSRNITVLVQNK